MADPAVGRPEGIGLYNVQDCGKVRCPDLRPTSVVDVMGGAKAAKQRIGKILIALTALTRTASCVTETQAPPKKYRFRGRKAGMTDPRVRRLYLQHSKHGAADLDALQAEPQGTLRGHWRQQWFPSVQEHRWQWIDGFPRGDFSKGTVAGERTVIAPPPRPDHTGDE